MSQGNVEIVRQMIDALQDRDLVAWWRQLQPNQMRRLIETLCDPDVEVAWIGTSPEAGIYRGHEGAIQAFDDWLESFEEYEFQATDLIAVSDQVIVPRYERGRGRASGAHVEMTTAWLIKLRGGKVFRLWEYPSIQQALEAAGLSE